MLQLYYREFTLPSASPNVNIVFKHWTFGTAKILTFSVSFEKLFVYLEFLFHRCHWITYQTILENVNTIWFASHKYLREYSSLGYPGFLLSHSQSSILGRKMINGKAVLFVCTCFFSLPLKMLVLFWSWSPFCFFVNYIPPFI